MDCTKLQEDAKKAQTSLDALRSDTAMRDHNFRTIVKRYSYSYKSAGNDTNTHILKPIDENSWQEHRWTFRRYLGESYEDLQTKYNFAILKTLNLSVGIIGTLVFLYHYNK